MFNESINKNTVQNLNSESNNANNIAIMGMGYVGLTLSVILAKHDFNTHGIEIHEDTYKNLKDGIPHFQEKGLAPLLINQQEKNKLMIHNSLPEVNFGAYIISVGTPLHKGEKKPNINYIENVLKDVGTHMKKGSLVILRSTIPVGLSRSFVIPMLEKVSGLTAGDDFSFAFAPERTAEGKALEELKTNPQIIGGYDEKSTKLAAEIFSKITPTTLKVSSLEAAEMIKIIDNSSRDIRFAYSNEIAMICEKLNLDAKELIDAANTHYPRNNIPHPSPGVGGACLSKDPHILNDFAKDAGHDADLIKSGRDINERVPGEIVKRLKTNTHLPKPLSESKVFIVGFAFKGNPETSDLRDSTTLWFLDELKKEVPLENIYGYDKVIAKSEISKLGVKACDSIYEGCESADIILFMNNHASYLDLDPFKILSNMNKPCIFYDAWRMFDKTLFQGQKGIKYWGVGV